MKDFALKFLEYFGLGAEELSEMPPMVQTLLELLPLTLGVGFIIGIFVAFTRFHKEEDEKEGEEGISELDKEIALIKSLQRR